jgi:hypothetical protein
MTKLYPRLGKIPDYERVASSCSEIPRSMLEGLGLVAERGNSSARTSEQMATREFVTEQFRIESAIQTNLFESWLSNNHGFQINLDF